MSDEIVDAPVVTTEAPSAPVATPEPTVDDTMREVLAEIRAREPNRADDGKFQPKVVAEGTAPEGTDVPGKPELAAPEPAPPAIDAPQSLPDDVKKVWATLPPNVQQAWAKRESESTQKITTDGQRLKSLEAYEEVAVRVQDRLKQLGATPQAYYSNLHDADVLLVRDGPAGLRHIAQMYGIDPRAAFGTPGQQPDPSSALTTKISELESRLAEREKADEQARLNDATQRIEQFKKDRPYFDDATDMMDKLIRSGAAKGLEDAYDMAINAHPEIRTKREAAAKAEADKKAAEEAKARAEKDAKIAPFARRPGSAPAVASKKGSWEDTMKEVQADIRARG